jgi:hypothetical protein
MNSLAEYKVTPLQMARFWAEQNYQVYNILGACLTESAFVASAEVQSLWDYVAVPAEDVALQRIVVEVLSKPPDWHRVSAHLDGADYHVKMALCVPPLVGFRGIKGWLAKRIAKLIIYGNQVIAGPQKECSQSLLYSSRALLHILRNRAKEEACEAARLGELAAQVTALRQQLSQQQQDFALQSELLAHLRNQIAELGKTTSKESHSDHPGALDRAA